MIKTINRPIPFQGTPEAEAANLRTHRFYDYPEGTYCDACLAKPWHATATWPCGTEAPREIITLG